MIPKTFLLPLVLLSGTIATSAQTDKIDDYLKAEMAKGRIPGLSVAVLRDGKLLTARSYGLANVEFSIPMSRETLHQLASATKMFTGTAIMMLVEEEKLSNVQGPACPPCSLTTSSHQWRHVAQYALTSTAAAIVLLAHEVAP